MPLAGVAPVADDTVEDDMGLAATPNPVIRATAFLIHLLPAPTRALQTRAARIARDVAIKLTASSCCIYMCTTPTLDLTSGASLSFEA